MSLCMQKSIRFTFIIFGLLGMTLFILAVLIFPERNLLYFLEAAAYASGVSLIAWIIENKFIRISDEQQPSESLLEMPLPNHLLYEDGLVRSELLHRRALFEARLKYTNFEDEISETEKISNEHH